MKKGLKICFVVLMLFSLFGCKKQEEENVVIDEKQGIDLADKNYFNVYEGHENSGHSNVHFNKDLSFELVDYLNGNKIELKGTYEIKDKTIELSVSNNETGQFNKVVFNIINDEVLSLQTNMFDSFVSNIYIHSQTFDDFDKAIDVQRVNAKEIISGKTYYDVIDRYGNSDTSNIIFNSDGTFNMNEHYHEEFVHINGKWEVNEYKIRCHVEECGIGEFKEIVFYMSDFEKLFLETELFSSKEDDIFTSEKVSITAAQIEDDEPYTNGVFLNASQKARGEFGVSELTLRSDGTFTLSEVAGMGATLINGLYGREKDVFMFSNFDSSLFNMNGEEVFNFEFRIINDNTLELIRDLEGSRAGDCFSVDGELPVSYTPQYLKEDAVYLHEPIDDVMDDYLPKIELYGDGTFLFIENCYAGMGQYKGTYSVAGKQLLLDVKDNSSMQGFAGQDVKLIVLEQTSKGYVLKTNLCMSANGDEFILQ